MWDLSSVIRIEPASPALQGGFLTTGPPGKLPDFVFFFFFLMVLRAAGPARHTSWGREPGQRTRNRDPTGPEPGCRTE